MYVHIYTRVYPQPPQLALSKLPGQLLRVARLDMHACGLLLGHMTCCCAWGTNLACTHAAAGAPVGRCRLLATYDIAERVLGWFRLSPSDHAIKARESGGKCGHSAAAAAKLNVRENIVYFGAR